MGGGVERREGERGEELKSGARVACLPMMGSLSNLLRDLSCKRNKASFLGVEKDAS